MTRRGTVCNVMADADLRRTWIGREGEGERGRKGKRRKQRI